jgi:hypothetical protein
MCDDYCEGLPCRDYDDCRLVKDIRKPCPECGSQPTIETTQWGNAYGAAAVNTTVQRQLKY